MSFVICNIRISFVIHVHAYIWSACARNLCKAVFWRDHWTHFQKPLPQGLPGWWIPTTSPIGRAHPRNPYPFIHVVYIYIQGHAYEDILPDGLNRLQSCLNWYIYIYTHVSLSLSASTWAWHSLTLVPNWICLERRGEIQLRGCT